MIALKNRLLIIAVLGLQIGCGSAPTPGPQGPQGAQGEPGANGLPAATPSATALPEGVTVTSYTQCSKLDNSVTNNQSSLGVNLSYTQMLYSNGDSFVTCSVYDRVSQSTSTLYKMHGQSNGHCIVTSDLSTYNSGPNAEGGMWVFNDTSALPSITYIDTNNTKSGYNVSYVSSECSVMSQ